MAEVNNEISLENGGEEQQDVMVQEEQQPEQPMDVSGVEGEVEEKKSIQKNRPAGRTVIVKNLPPSHLFTIQDVLKEKFAKYGDLQYVRLGGVTVDFDTIMPTLAAYINYSDPESSEKAMVENGSEIDGYSINMQILKTNEYTMVVNNVPCTITEDCIQSLFSSCGYIKNVIKIPSRPTVFVEFDSEEGLQQALSLNGTLVVNNVELLLQKQGEEKKQPSNKQRKMKSKSQKKQRQIKAGENNDNGNNIVPQNNRPKPLGRINKGRMGGGGNRMGGGMGGGMGMGMGMMGNNNRNWGGNGGNMGWGGMGYNNWDGMNYNNSWGNNGNNYGGGNNGPRGNKRRKNDWWQY